MSVSRKDEWRMLLADGEPNVRFALRVLLEQRPGCRVVGEAGETRDLIAAIETACPDVLLLDWSFGEGGLEALLRVLRQHCPDLAVIVLSGRPEARRAALAAGADAFASKSDPPERLLEAVEAIQRPARRCA